MIEAWRVLVRAVRRGRLALVPLLAVLITAHLASAAHSAPFAGPHVGVVAICPPAHHAAAGPHQAAGQDAGPGAGHNEGAGQDAGAGTAPPTAVPGQLAPNPEQLTPNPAHEHDGSRHVDHSVDRPRDPGGAQEPQLPELPAVFVSAPAVHDAHRAPPVRAVRPPAGPPGCDGDRSSLGIWRL
ncbi:hypothetical protein [Streptomyces indicus]|uniref:Secreted protein n=1 Tax=Streptomyces indicus TaxID=417292 RepID=A0A1G9CBB8_9ACTN|nr:hypothetical protein [Streptomyces indicus]SDK48973.1 hypothetical protein SAMN05421806_10844 [Streptomyces indicus]